MLISKQINEIGVIYILFHATRQDIVKYLKVMFMLYDFFSCEKNKLVRLFTANWNKSTMFMVLCLL